MNKATLDVLFICRDGRVDSLLSSLYLAREMKGTGLNVAVLFAGEALQAVCGEAMLWPRGLQEQPVRLTMADRAKAMGLPVVGRSDGRQIDRRGLLTMAREANIKMFACAPWVSLLALEKKLPRGVKAADEATTVQMLSEAKRVIGSL